VCDEGYEARDLECVPIGSDGDGDGDGDIDSDTDADTDTDGDVDPDDDVTPECVGESVSVGMVLVPAGNFWMGCNSERHFCIVEENADNQPYHEVYLDAFEIDRTEVTVSEYRECAEADECEWPRRGEDSNMYEQDHDDHPVNYVSWYDAESYCSFRGKRLCTEAEWEKAARGTDGRFFPWGDEVANCSRGVFSGADHTLCTNGGTMAVGLRPAGCSPYGVLDIMGNVFEWVFDRYSRTYYSESPRENPQGPEDGGFRVIRGDSYMVNIAFVNLGGIVTRFDEIDEFQRRDIGIRCCRSVP
jgi:formylglycine-generating enzyme required for sulfatase activity